MLVLLVLLVILVLLIILVRPALLAFLAYPAPLALFIFSSHSSNSRCSHSPGWSNYYGATRTVLGFGLVVRYAGMTATMAGELDNGVRLQ